MNREDADAAEAALLGRVADGEREEPLGALYDRYGARLYRLGVRLLGDPTIAEELVQEVFVRLWQSAGRYDPAQGSVGTWMRMLARRVAIDLQRRAAARARLAVHGHGPGGEARDPVEGLVTEDAVDRLLLGLEVREALGRLTPKQREVLLLGYDEQLTQSEIAERLEVPLGTVKSRTIAGLRALRDVLEEMRLT